MHQMSQVRGFAVVFHPSRRTQGGQSLSGASPGISRDGPDEGWIIEGNRRQRIGRPEVLRIVNLPAIDGFEELLIDNVLSQNAGDEVAANADKVILRIEVVEASIR